MNAKFKGLTQIIHDSNTLLLKENCDDAADCIVDIIRANNENSTHDNLKKTVIEFTQKLCRRKASGKHFTWDKSNIDVLFAETLCLEREDDLSRKTIVKSKALKQLSADFPMFIFNFESSDGPTADLMYALSNLNTKESLKALDIRINTAETVEEDLYKCYLRIWNEKGLDLTDETYEILTKKIISHVEQLFLELATILITDKFCYIEDLLQTLKFKPLNTFLKRTATSRICFHCCTLILNEIFIISNYNSAIQKLVTFVINELKSLTSHSLTSLYPYDLQTLVFYLNFEPCDLKESTRTDLIIENVITSLRNIKQNEVNSFVMLLSHHPEWMKYYDSK